MFRSCGTFFISREASTAGRRYKKERWKGKLHVHGHVCPSPPHWIWDSFQQPRQKLRMASSLEVVSMIADIGQQQWSCTNFQLSDRTLRSRYRILEFSQELVKMYAATYNFGFRVDFGMSGRYKQPVQYGRDTAHESRAAWAVFSLGVCMRERQRGSERELFSQSRRKSAVGDSAEPKQ